MCRGASNVRLKYSDDPWTAGAAGKTTSAAAAAGYYDAEPWSLLEESDERDRVVARTGVEPCDECARAMRCDAAAEPTPEVRGSRFGRR